MFNGGPAGAKLVGWNLGTGLFVLSPNLASHYHCKCTVHKLGTSPFMGLSLSNANYVIVFEDILY